MTLIANVTRQLFTGQILTGYKDWTEGAEKQHWAPVNYEQTRVKKKTSCLRNVRGGMILFPSSPLSQLFILKGKLQIKI